MKIRIVALSLVLIGLAGAARAGGTPEQEAACRPDVRKFCHHVPRGSDDGVYLTCLQEHRPKLSVPCRTMLESNGV